MQDSRPFFQPPQNFFQHSLETEQEAYNESSYFPKQTNFFENYTNSPLTVSRFPTDTTETSEHMQNSRIGLSPTFASFKKTATQELPYNITANFAPKEIQLQNPKSKYAIIGSNTGVSFNMLKPEPAKPEIHQFQSSLQSQLSNKLEKEQVKDENADEDVPHSYEVTLNAQLKGLLEAKIWNEEKDHILLKLGTQYKCDWKKISKRFAHKKITPNFLKIRYKELTCAPLQRRIKFNHKEDLLIAKYFEKYGSNWASMAVHFRDRTAIMLKNRYYSFIRKRELLEYLLDEVRNLEKDGTAVDDIQDMDPELYTDPYATKKDGSKNESGNSCDEDTYSEEPEPKQHQIFGYESTRGSEFINSNGYKSGEEEKVYEDTDQSQSDHYNDMAEKCAEIMRLKERVSTMENLYYKTKAELDHLKGTKSF